MGERPTKRDEAPPSCCAPVRPASDGISRTPQSGVCNGGTSAEGMIHLPGGTLSYNNPEAAEKYIQRARAKDA